MSKIQWQFCSRCDSVMNPYKTVYSHKLERYVPLCKCPTCGKSGEDYEQR